MKRRNFLGSVAAAIGGFVATPSEVLAADSELDCGVWYDAEVTDAADGDTFDVEVDANGKTYTVRTLGIDTPEKSGYTRFEEPEGWEFIEDEAYLEEWGNEASEFAAGELPAGTRCQIKLDCESEEIDQYDRLLAKVRYDRSGDGSMDTVYNELALREGYARTYAASMTNTDEYLGIQETARAEGRGVWGGAADSVPEWRNEPVAETFHPHTSSIRTTDGALPDSRAPVWAESEAVQEDTTSDTVAYDDPPLVGVDEANNLAYFGGVPINEEWEKKSAPLEHFVFVANLIDHLHDAADPSGPVLVDGGHHTFGEDHAISAEDTAYFQRYLEGVGVELHSINTYGDSTGYSLSDARALVASCSPDAWTDAEVSEVQNFVDDGGVVVLMGSGSESSADRTRLDDLAAGLGSDLRINDDAVRDDANNVGNRKLVKSTNLNATDFSLWSEYGGSGGDDDSVVEFGAIEQYPAETLDDEYVELTNTGSADQDMTGWTLSNADGDTYSFPDGFTLTAGGTVRVHTGSGTDSDSDGDLYWGASMFRWDNDKDTASLRDAEDNLVRRDSWALPDVVIPALDPDDEWVDFENRSDETVKMAGWTVEDAAGSTYEFPGDFSLGAGETVRLHTGDGTDTDTDLYWGDSYVWNNDGDTCYLYDDAGELVQKYTYPAPYSLSVPEMSLSGDTLNDEYVDVRNEGGSLLDMSGYTLEDEGGNTYTFPDSFTLAPDATVRVHTGEGTDTTTDLYWGRGAGIWNDDGDTAYVYDDNGRLAVKQNSADAGGGSNGLTADPNTAGSTATHTWTLADPSSDFSGEVDTITVDYPSGTSLDGLTDADVTVYIDDNGNGTAEEIPVNSDEYSGSSATFDLDGRYDTSVQGEVRVVVDGVTNPSAGDYVATETLDGDDTHSVDLDFVVE